MNEQSPSRSSYAHSKNETSGCSSETCVDIGRRRVLIAVGSAGSVVLAGCVEADDEDEEVASYDVTFLDEGEEFETSIEEDEELLYPALDAGVEIPYSCEVGVCGQCTVKYDGDANEVVAHDGNDYLDDDQISDGWVLTCVAYPRDDSELEVAHPDDTDD